MTRDLLEENKDLRETINKLEKENAELKKELAISEHDREHNDYELTEVYKKIAELEAHLPQWHDLRKNPEDLPKEDAEYACRIPRHNSEKTFNGFLNYSLEQKVFWLDNLGLAFPVIAWCEIPEF